MTRHLNAWGRRSIEKEIKEAGDRYSALADECRWWKRRAEAAEAEIKLLRDAEWERHFVERESRALCLALGLNPEPTDLEDSDA